MTARDFLYHNFDIIMLNVAYLSEHKISRVVFETHLCRLHYRMRRQVEVCDVILEEVQSTVTKCDDGSWGGGNFSLKSRGVICG